jgi:hypothetical protein
MSDGTNRLDEALIVFAAREMAFIMAFPHDTVISPFVRPRAHQGRVQQV